MIQQFPNDISTVFSIVPFEVFEFKPGLYPGSFKVPACLNDSEPESLVIGASEHLMSIGGKKEPIRIMTPSYQIAQSVVTDFLDGQMWTNPDAHPGICWIQGKVATTTFLKDHIDIYNRIKTKQKNWFVRLCKETDNAWAKTQNHRVVSDQARFASKFLGLDPIWMRAEEIGFTYKKCPACSIANDPANAVCTGCRCILDEEKYKSLKFAS